MKLRKSEIADKLANQNREKAKSDFHYAQMAYRIRVLPEQLERARNRVAMLEKEAAEYGMRDLLA